MDIKINEEYSKLVPPLTDKDYEGLKLSIEFDGQHYPIVINEDDYILDGHTRFKICQELGRECRYEVMRFSSKLKEIEFVANSNLKRRHLNDFQKAELGYNLENLYNKYARARQLSNLKQGNKVPTGSNDPNGETGRTADIIAKQVNISPSIYKRAKKIILEGSESGKVKLRTGKSTIFKEYKKVVIDERKKQLINEKQKIDLPNNCQLHEGDFMEIGKNIPDNSIDLIITDPPYIGKDLTVFEDLAIFANRVLKDSGSLVLFMGQFDLLSKGNIMENNGLKYTWQICVKHNGHRAKARGSGILINVLWKPLVWFVKGSKTNSPCWINDLIESEPPNKIGHEWEQSTVEAEHVIKWMTVENQIVLDPFMGYATNGVAALKLNRKFIGIEIDPTHYSNAQRRLSSTRMQYVKSC